MIRYLFTFLLALAGIFTVCAQSADAIGETLLENSNAVVRLAQTEFVYSSPTSGTEKCILELTVLNKSAADKAHFTCYTDNTRSLKSFSGELFDRNGKSLRKLKRSELKYTEYSTTSLADDGAYYYMEVYAPTYPYTVRFEYEIGYRNGILVFPTFLPIGEQETSLEKGIYTLSLPEGTEFGYKCANIDAKPIKHTESGRDIYRWTLENVPAICKETAAPPLLELVPVIHAIPRVFEYEHTKGRLDNWATYGAWQCSLLAGRDVLPEELKQEIHRRTNHLATSREKVKALYDYLGETTRYVSIQLGIGGLQPIAVADVYKTKFGDCKALSNYMRAMLAECGIESNYTIIHASRPRIFPDFPSPAQANHVILRVPLAEETLYLECTNPEVPFGYIHDRIAGHDAVYFRNGTGEFITLPQYADTLNRMVQRVEMDLAEDGSARGHIKERYEVGQYGDKAHFVKLDARKRADYLLSDLKKIPLIRLDGIECQEEKSSLPSIEFDYAFVTPKYGNVTGNRIFLPQSPFSNHTSPRSEQRLYDIYYSKGYMDQTSVIIRIPDNMEIEARPKNCEEITPFGRYSSQLTVEKGRITIEHRTTMHAGTYPREQYEEYREFLRGRARSFNANLVLRKKQAGE